MTGGLLGEIPAWAGIAVAGAGFGLGSWLVILGLLPSRPKLSAVLATALAPPPPAPRDAVDGSAQDGLAGVPGRQVVRVSLPTARTLHRAGLPTARTGADLRVIGRPAVAHLAIAVTAALAAFLAPAVLSLPLAVAGVGGLPVWVWLGCGAVGFLLPDLQVRSAATRKRAELRRAVGAMLDLTAIALAGGAGVEQALHGAAAVGAGWAHDRLRAALHGARTTLSDPWTALGRLGADLGVDELTELAATLALAGTEGARVRASLTAKAAALRAHLQTGEEASAASATERMSLPVIVLFAGYLVFIGYPALSLVLAL